MNEKNDSRLILFLVLAVVLFTIWNGVYGSKPAPEQPPVTTTESGATPAPATLSAASSTPTPPTPIGGPCTEEKTDFTHKEIALTVSNCGGLLTQVALPNHPPPIQSNPWWTWAWERLSGKTSAPWSMYQTHRASSEHFLSPEGTWLLTGREDTQDRGAYTLTKSGDTLTMERVGEDGLKVTKILAPTADPDILSVTIRWEALQPLVGPFWVQLSDAFEHTSGRYDIRATMALVADDSLTQITSPQDLVNEPKLFTGPISWWGVEDHYFLAALMPSDPAWGEVKATSLGEGVTALRYASKEGNLLPGKPLEASFKLYVGPKNVERLGAVGSGLENAANLGFFGFFSKILLFFLHLFQKAVVNWGLSIISLTVFVRVVMWPLAARAYKNQKAMQVVQPLLKELQEKYKDDREAQTRETMKLFAEYKVNPFGGCLPLIVQMPIFFALYSALSTTPDLYHASFLWIIDLSAPDPTGVFPVVIAIGMLFQQRMMPMPENMDPAQAQMMRWMPLMFALFMFSLPAGISLYYVVNTALAIAQQWYNMRSYATPAPPSTPAGTSPA